MKVKTVTEIVNKIKQPHGGYIQTRWFKQYSYDDGIILNKSENILANIIGLCVEYLTQKFLGFETEYVFKSCLYGVNNYLIFKGETDNSYFKYILREIDKAYELTDDVIKYALELCSYDVCYKTGDCSYFKPIPEPNVETIENIRTMVKRGITFFEKEGIPCECGFSVSDVTPNIVGFGDFLTDDTIIDFKTVNGGLTAKYTLQLFLYYRLGIFSNNRNLWNVSNIGIFNPRLNKYYVLNVNDIPEDVLNTLDEIFLVKSWSVKL